MSRELSSGHRIDGKYEIIRLLGEGGMGQVYEARDRALGRRVALKVLPERSQGDPEARERLSREGKAVARLQHRNVVRVYEVGSDGELDYVAMELLQGVATATQDPSNLGGVANIAPGVYTVLAERDGQLVGRADSVTVTGGVLTLVNIMPLTR